MNDGRTIPMITSATALAVALALTAYGCGSSSSGGSGGAGGTGASSTSGDSASSDSASSTSSASSASTSTSSASSGSASSSSAASSSASGGSVVCSGIKSNQPCVGAGTCGNLVCGLADTGTRSCSCDGSATATWKCVSCMYDKAAHPEILNTPNPNPPAACSGQNTTYATRKGQACTMAENLTFCTPTDDATKACVCYQEKPGKYQWDCDSIPPTW